MKYRKDIQILRGVAVLLVVLFHFGFTGFNSGFLGVDVFFVISGYLMAVMYDPLKTSDFFIKRAKRLLPAYFVVVALTILLSIVIINPNDFAQVSRQGWFATIFASNIGFWTENSYFDKVTFKPLLHLWSIAVEVQFYLLVPFLYWAIRKLKISYLFTMVASALLCFVVVGIQPSVAFFLLPFRLWEFLIGFGVAQCIPNKIGGRKEYLAWLGAFALVSIICIPVFKVDGMALGFENGHPGLLALLICLATATTLSFGIPKIIEKNPISNFLEKIGGYSYSIYLAHFPIIVLFMYQPFSGTITKATSLTQTASIAVLVISLSTLLYKFVEKPFRTYKRTPTWILAFAISTIFVSVTGAMLQSAFIPASEMLVYQAWFDRDEFRCGKWYSLVHRGNISCEITSQIDKPSHRIFLVGNSHADSIKKTFSSIAQTNNNAVYFVVQNDPLMKDSKIDLKLLIHEAISKQIDLIVLHYSPGAIDFHVVAQLTELTKANGIKLAFIMPVPVWDENVPKMLIENLRNERVGPIKSMKDYNEVNGGLMDGLAKIDYDKFKVYQVAHVFCRNTCLLISNRGNPLYFDSSHLTLTGSEMLQGVFERVNVDLLN